MRLSAVGALIVVALVLLGALAAGCSRPADPARPVISAECLMSSPVLPAVAGDVAYTLILRNQGSQPVRVAGVAVIFRDFSGHETGTDDPAQQDFPGDAHSVRHFNVVLIGPGQLVIVPMETARIGGWSCSLGKWWSR